ncbi:MAG: aminotransferase class I/II-fold pyridoxal phosphate-dependent enzyme [Coriobacteriia bacterium]|nr:aminotransferase class I/II-fold pyridoxal phosphate-dependent enzyme [Coriobacteriia bacterium]
MTVYDYSMSTVAARAGTEVDTAYNSMGIPIYMTNNYLFDNVSGGAEACRSPEFGDCYTRVSNPTNNELGKAMASLEGCEAGLPFATGAAATSTLALALLKSGDHVVCDDTTYSATNYLFSTLLAKYGVEATFLDFTDYEALRAAMRPNTRLVFFETPCNPTMKVIDIAEVAGIVKACGGAKDSGATGGDGAKDSGATGGDGAKDGGATGSDGAKDSGAEDSGSNGGTITVVDNTFSTPFITRPKELGIDIVMHSSTKYICGHGDAMGGILTGSRGLIDTIMDVGLKNLGGTASPFNSFLMLRGLKTLELRMERHCKMAMAVAKYLDGHPKIERVYYPGLASHPGHETAKKQMSAFGGLLTFELKGGMNAGVTLMDNLKLCALAVSLGEANTLVQHPASMTHWYVPEEARRASGITDGLIRFSTGLESTDDILTDLEETLKLV